MNKIIVEVEGEESRVYESDSFMLFVFKRTDEGSGTTFTDYQMANGGDVAPIIMSALDVAVKVFKDPAMVIKIVADFFDTNKAAMLDKKSGLVGKKKIIN